MNDKMNDKEKLAIATSALRWYADKEHYANDDWFVLSVIQPPEYGNPGCIARTALDSIE